MTAPLPDSMAGQDTETRGVMIRTHSPSPANVLPAGGSFIRPAGRRRPTG